MNNLFDQNTLSVFDCSLLAGSNMPAPGGCFTFLEDAIFVAFPLGRTPQIMFPAKKSHAVLHDYRL